jgi:hypothetical protein
MKRIPHEEYLNARGSKLGHPEFRRMVAESVIAQFPGVPFGEHFSSMMGGWLQKEITVADAIRVAIHDSPLHTSEIHGFSHWASVMLNGLCLMKAQEMLVTNELDEKGITRKIHDYVVLFLFSMFHDCRRWQEGRCTDHGAHGAMALYEAFGTECPAVRVAAEACMIHTGTTFPRAIYEGVKANPVLADRFRIIGLCLDADRMDLTRLGQRPNAAFMTLTHPEVHPYDLLREAMEIRRKISMPDLFLNFV